MHTYIIPCKPTPITLSVETEVATSESDDVGGVADSSSQHVDGVTLVDAGVTRTNSPNAQVTTTLLTDHHTTATTVTFTAYTVMKYPHIHGNFVASFPDFEGTGSVPYTFVICFRKSTRNNEARAHIAMWARASLFRRFTNTNM